MGSGSRISRILFGVAILVGFLWFLYLGLLANHTMIKRNTVSSTATFEQWKLIGKKKHGIHHDFNLNYVSKRLVPNGPDPIHNRRASQLRQPPARY